MEAPAAAAEPLSVSQNEDLEPLAPSAHVDAGRLTGAGGWSRRASIAALMLAGVAFVAFVATLMRPRQGLLGTEPDATVAKYNLSLSTGTDTRGWQPKIWQAFGNGHQVVKREGSQIQKISHYTSTQCSHACDGSSRCKSFVMCKDTCYLKTQELTGTEPTNYVEYCSSYYYGPPKADNQRMVWLILGSGNKIPDPESDTIKQVRGSQVDCERACQQDARCRSFSRNGNTCWLKDAGITGHERVKGHICNFWYQALDGMVPPAPCGYGQVRKDDGSCWTPPVGSSMSFYIYRAQSMANYPLNEGLNVANLGGVLWYLHNEVAGHCPRKFNVERVIRYKLTMKASDPLASAGRNFDQFLQFDASKCTNPKCAEVFNKYGYVAGCFVNSQGVAAYPESTWISLPGQCPFMTWDQKTPQCRANEPGGMCEHPDGSRTCTYDLEFAGDVTMEELTGIQDYRQWCKSHNELTSISFWRGKTDKWWCEGRIERLQGLFYAKYPNLPADLGQPRCDWR